MGLFDGDQQALQQVAAQVAAMNDAVTKQTNMLAEFLKRETELLNTFLIEGGTCPSVGTGATPWTIAAQTGDVEVITSIVTKFPNTATGIILQLDDIAFQLPTGVFISPPLQIPVRKNIRSVTWGNAQATDQPFVLLCARPAPAAVPYILH